VNASRLQLARVREDEAEDGVDAWTRPTEAGRRGGGDVRRRWGGRDSPGVGRWDQSGGWIDPAAGIGLAVSM
jgi:hypothetical protein